GGACGTKSLPEGAGGEPGSDPPDGGGGGKGLFAQRLPDERPCLDPPEVVREPGRDDDPELARPAQDHEQVSVRHGEAAAEKEVAAHLAGQDLEEAGDAVERSLAPCLAGLAEQRLESHVQLARNERQRLEQPDPPEVPLGLQVRSAIGDQREDRNVLGERPPVVEHEERNVALGIEFAEVAAGLGQPGRKVDALLHERNSGFVQRDPVRKAARAARIVELHESALLPRACFAEVGGSAWSSHRASVVEPCRASGLETSVESSISTPRKAAAGSPTTSRLSPSRARTRRTASSSVKTSGPAISMIPLTGFDSAASTSASAMSSAATGWNATGGSLTAPSTVEKRAIAFRDSKAGAARAIVYGMPDSATSRSSASLARK